MSIRKTITAFGGITALSRALGHRNPSTVQGWWERDVIPAKRQRSVLKAAASNSIPVSAADLIGGCE